MTVVSGMNVRAVAFGAPATTALAEWVQGAKQVDALAPVTVVVPTHYVGVATRRALASAGGGVAAISFTTLHRLAELLGGARLAAAGRRPVSAPVIGAALRAALGDEPGIFAPVAAHPATEEALTTAYRELAGVEPATRTRLADQSARAADVVRITSAARAALAADWYDEHDLAESAAATVRESGSDLAASIGPVLLHLPERLERAEADLLGALAGATTVTVHLGVTGVAAADDPVVGRIEGLLGVTARAATPPPQPPLADHIVSVSDPDDEVRVVVRAVIDQMRAGIPLGRMAVAYGTSEPYATLLHDHLAAAGIPRNGVSVRRLADSIAGRTLRTFLALPDNAFRRRDVLGLLATAPIRDPATGRRAHSRAWERAARQASVIDGDDWDIRLPGYAADCTARAKDSEREGRDTRARMLHHQARWAGQLTQFVRALRADIALVAHTTSWAAMAARSQELLRAYLGDDHDCFAWPAYELHALHRIEAALERLASLDHVPGGPPPTLEVFRRALDTELDANLPRVGRLGEGILVGPISAVVGIEVDRLMVVGMAEGSFPPRRLDDSLLPDDERARAGDDLPLRAARLHHDHRHLLAALAGAAHSTLLYPRGDLRRSGERPASRWLIEQASAHAGRRVFTADLRRHRLADWYTEQPSFTGGLAGLSFPATTQEFAVRTLLAHPDRPETHPLVATTPQLVAGLDLIRSRRSDRFTRFDGNLGHAGVRSPIEAGRPVSPTALETWATCPHAYLMEKVLHVEVPEDPDRELQMSALDKGSLVHAVLEDLIRDEIEQRQPPRSAASIADFHCLAFEARGLVGRALFWRLDRARLLADLGRFEREDGELRASLKSTPVAVEMSVEGATIDLADGRQVHFRGSADRVDRTDDGGLVVIDYKSGGTRKFKGLGPADPHRGGTCLQLAVYGQGARVHHGRPDTPVRALYWFVTTKGEFQQIGYDVTDEVLARVAEALSVIVDGIGGGVFPARPNPDPPYTYIDCHYCDPDGLGTGELRRGWERKSADAALADYVKLSEPDLLADDEAVARG